MAASVALVAVLVMSPALADSGSQVSAATLSAAAQPLATTPAPTPSPDVEADRTPALSIAPSGEGVVTGTQTFALSAHLVHAPASATEVGFAMSDAPLLSPAEVAAWLDGSDIDTETPIVLGTTPLATTAPDDGAAPRSGSVTVDAAAVGIGDLVPGVYALQGTSAAAGLTARSVVVVRDPGQVATGPVATIVPLTGPATSEGLLTSEELATLTGTGGALRAQLDAVTGSAAVLAVDPALPAAIRALGTQAPESATAWLNDLLALPNQRFALQFGDADLAAQVAAGVSQPLSPSTLAPLLPTPEGDDAPPPPALEGLLDIGPAIADVYWPATGTADETTVSALATFGRSDGPAVTLASVSSAEEDDEAAGAWLLAGDAPVLAYDPLLSTALRDVSTSDAGMERSAASAAVSAYASFADLAEPLVAVIDRAPDRDPSGLRDAIAAATRLDGRPAAALTALTADEPTEATLPDAGTEAARVGILNDLLSDEERLTQFATILDDPTLLTAPERAQLLQLMGNAWRDDDRWTETVAAHRTATATTLDSVRLTQSSDIILLGTNSSLLFTVRNDLEWPVSLVAIAQPRDPRLIVQTTTDVEAGAAQNTRIEIPVESRIASGETTLDLRLLGPTDATIGEPVSVAVSVRAEWEGVGIVVMAVGIAGLLIAGAVRTIKRLRHRPPPADKNTDKNTERKDADG